MTANILDQVSKTNTKRHHKLLREYRGFLAVENPKQSDADKLIETAHALHFELSRFPSDTLAVRELARLQATALDLPVAQTEHESAFDKAEKHKVSMRKKISALEEKQAELDAVVSSAGGRRQRAQNAIDRVKQLRVENEELFADMPDEAAEAEYRRLQAQADELPSLREQMSTLEADLAEAETVADKAIDVCNGTSAIAKNKMDVIQAKATALAHRNAIAAKISDLYLEIDRAENAQRRLG